MSTYIQCVYQIVFSTKNRQPSLKKENRRELFKYVWGILENSKCHLYRINGVDDHIHIVTHLHQSIALADLVKNIKIASSQYIKDKTLFENFNGWQEGYGAFTYSYSDKDTLIDYVKNQEEHHKLKTFKDEYMQLLQHHGVAFDEKYLL